MLISDSVWKGMGVQFFLIWSQYTFKLKPWEHVPCAGYYLKLSLFVGPVGACGGPPPPDTSAVVKLVPSKWTQLRWEHVPS